MPLFRNGHENDSDSFQMISGFEYNLSLNLFFHTQATSQELFWYNHLKY